MGHDNGIPVTTVVVEQMAHRAVSVVCHECLNKFINITIQTAIVTPHHILPYSKTHMAPLGSIIVKCVACSFCRNKRR